MQMCSRLFKILRGDFVVQLVLFNVEDDAGYYHYGEGAGASLFLEGTDCHGMGWNTPWHASFQWKERYYGTPYLF